MNTNDLIKLAHKADIEGDHELADYLDRQIIRLSAFKPLDWIKNVGKNVIDYGKNLVSKNYLPKYNTPFTSLAPDASNLDAIAGAPAPYGTKAQKFFQYGVKNVPRTPEQLTEIGNKIKLAIVNVQSDDPDVKNAVQLIKNGTPAAMTTTERNALLDHLVNKAQVARRNNNISPDDILKVLSGKTPDAPFKEVTTLSNFGKSLLGAGVVGTGIAGYGALNQGSQQAALQPGGVYQNTPSSFNTMPEMGGQGGGGGMPTMDEMPMGGGAGGGYQGPNYNMPSANQSFQPMQGYQPANQTRVMDYPRTDDMAQPLYPRLTQEQAMEYAKTQDDARKHREMMDQGGRPADTDIVGPGTPNAQESVSKFKYDKEIYGPTQETASPGGVTIEESPETTEYLPGAPNLEGTSTDKGANVIYTPGTSPATPYNQA